ncbi:MAG: hypothetical protein WKH64_01825 [Chloroflexia bacterium]
MNSSSPCAASAPATASRRTTSHQAHPPDADGAVWEHSPRVENARASLADLRGALVNAGLFESFEG